MMTNLDALNDGWEFDVKRAVATKDGERVPCRTVTPEEAEAAGFTVVREGMWWYAYSDTVERLDVAHPARK